MHCWFCTSEFDAAEASFCSHIDPTVICPFCLKCACEAPENYKNKFLKNCPKQILEEKLIRESRTSLKLGEVLIRAGKINRTHLLTAIEKQKSFRQRIGQIFISMDLLTPEELSLYLLEQQWIDRIDLTEFEVDHDLVDKIGRTFCLLHKIIPIEYYEAGNQKILRFVLFSKEDLPKLKRSKELKDYILIPYESSEEDLKRLFRQIIENEPLVLE